MPKVEMKFWDDEVVILEKHTMVNNSLVYSDVLKRKKKQFGKLSEKEQEEAKLKANKEMGGLVRFTLLHTKQEKDNGQKGKS